MLEKRIGEINALRERQPPAQLVDDRTTKTKTESGLARPRGVGEQGRRYHRVVIAFFVALAIVVGVVEISVIIQVGQWIGFLNTVGLLLLVSLVGAWLVKRQGLGVMARIREQRSAGRIPATEAFDGALILVAGVLLVIPGFVTDALGLLLLIPPVRAVARRFVSRRVLREVEMVRSKQWDAWRTTAASVRAAGAPATAAAHTAAARLAP